FDPATPVLMADGTTRAIKGIKVGDKVTATDPTTGKTAAKPVTQLHINLDRDLTDLTLSPIPPAALRSLLSPTTTTVRRPAQVLHTTAHHPFWHQTSRKWTNAGNLAPGHKLVGPEGQTVYIVHVDNYAGAREMRNLTVADIHTYYAIAG